MGTLVDSEQKGDLLIRNLLEKGIDCVLNIQVDNTDAKSPQKSPPEK